MLKESESLPEVMSGAAVLRRKGVTLDDPPDVGIHLMQGRALSGHPPPVEGEPLASNSVVGSASSAAVLDAEEPVAQEVVKRAWVYIRPLLLRAVSNEDERVATEVLGQHEATIAPSGVKVGRHQVPIEPARLGGEPIGDILVAQRHGLRGYEGAASSSPMAPGHHVAVRGRPASSPSHPRLSVAPHPMAKRGVDPCRSARHRRCPPPCADRLFRRCNIVGTPGLALALVGTVFLFPLIAASDAWLRPRRAWLRTSQRRWFWGTAPTVLTLASLPLDTFLPSVLATAVAAYYLARVRPILTVATGLDHPRQRSAASHLPAAHQAELGELFGVAIVLPVFVVFVVVVHRNSRELVGGLVMALVAGAVIAARVALLRRR